MPSIPFNICCSFLLNTMGTTYNLKKIAVKGEYCLQAGLDVYKHVLCFPAGTSDKPLDTPCTEKYLASTIQKNSRPVSSENIPVAGQRENPTHPLLILLIPCGPRNGNQWGKISITQDMPSVV